MAKKFLLFLLAAVGLFQACDDGALGPVLSLKSVPVITSPGAGVNVVLTEATASDAFDITWTAADFGFQAAVTYRVELDVAGNDFNDPVNLGQTTSTALNLNREAVNTALFVTKGLVGEKAADLQIRVKATVSSDVDPVYSAPLSLTITPYTVIIIYPQLQVPGSYQGWDPGNNTTVIYSLKSNGKFEGYLYFGDDNTEFKFTDGPSWDTNYGDTGADGKLDKNGDNIKAAVAGMYKLNVDLNDLSYSHTLTTWGVVGSATAGGWDNDTGMTYDSGTRLMTVTADLVAGAIKFRANGAWDINFGDDGGDGRMEYGGADIPIAVAGNYTINLNLAGPLYTYTVTKN